MRPRAEIVAIVRTKQGMGGAAYVFTEERLRQELTLLNAISCMLQMERCLRICFIE